MSMEVPLTKEESDKFSQYLQSQGIQRQQKEEPKTTNEETAYKLIWARMIKEATELLSKQIQQKYIIHTTRSDDQSECWIYDEGIFKPQGKTYIQEFVRKETKEYYAAQIINVVLVKVEADTYIDQDYFFSKQNKYPYLIPVQNGVLNIDTNELLPHSSDYCFFNKLPVKYVPGVDCPFIRLFLEEVLPDQESLLTLQEFYGSCLLKEYRYEKSLMVTGQGSNGKGKTLELLKHLLGIENCAEISPQTLEEDMFAMGELVNKMANISGDINSRALENTGVFKSLTGRDLMMGARKFKTRVKFVNYAKMIFSSNEIPFTKDMTDGWFRRWLIIDFPYRFLDPEDIAELSEEDKQKAKVKDPEIMSKLTTEDELCGFLNWCLEGYQRLKRNKVFSNSQTIASVRTLWMRKANSVMAFMMDCVEEDYDGEISKELFKTYYVSYCRRHKIKQLSDKFIHNILTGNYNVTETRISFDDGRERCWKGIKFLNNGVEKPVH